MDIKRNYEYLLSDLSCLKGVGSKTTNLLKKKIYIAFLTYYGNCQNPTLIEVYLQKFKI